MQDIFNIRQKIFRRLQYCDNKMLEEFRSSCELIRRVDEYEELIESYYKRQGNILRACWLAKGIKFIRYNMKWLEE